MNQTHEFYDKEFSYGSSSLTRRELESLPCPFYTKNITDELMQKIVEQTEINTKMSLGLSDNDTIDLKNDEVNGIWWQEMEDVVNHYKIPYYEDLPENTEL